MHYQTQYFQYHKNPTPQNPSPPAGYLTRSPCRHRPDSEGPCPLLHADKNNNVCNTCHLVGNGSELRRTVDDVAELVRKKQVLYYRMQETQGAKLAPLAPEDVKLDPRRSTNGRCVVDGCGQPIDRRYCKGKGDFCGLACANLIGERLRRHRPPLLQNGFVDSNWLYRPRLQRSAGIFAGTTCDFPDCNETPRHRNAHQGLSLCTPHHTLVSRRLKNARRRAIDLSREEILAPGEYERGKCEWPSGCDGEVHRHVRWLGLDLCSRHYNRVRYRISTTQKSGRKYTADEITNDALWQTSHQP